MPFALPSLPSFPTQPTNTTNLPVTPSIGLDGISCGDWYGLGMGLRCLGKQVYKVLSGTGKEEKRIKEGSRGGNGIKEEKNGGSKIGAEDLGDPPATTVPSIVDLISEDFLKTTTATATATATNPSPTPASTQNFATGGIPFGSLSTSTAQTEGFFDSSTTLATTMAAAIGDAGHVEAGLEYSVAASVETREESDEKINHLLGIESVTEEAIREFVKMDSSGHIKDTSSHNTASASAPLSIPETPGSSSIPSYRSGSVTATFKSQALSATYDCPGTAVQVTLTTAATGTERMDTPEHVCLGAEKTLLPVEDVVGVGVGCGEALDLGGREGVVDGAWCEGDVSSNTPVPASNDLLSPTVEVAATITVTVYSTSTTTIVVASTSTTKAGQAFTDVGEDVDGTAGTIADEGAEEGDVTEGKVEGGNGFGDIRDESVGDEHSSLATSSDSDLAPLLDQPENIEHSSTAPTAPPSHPNSLHNLHAHPPRSVYETRNVPCFGMLNCLPKVASSLAVSVKRGIRDNGLVDWVRGLADSVIGMVSGTVDGVAGVVIKVLAPVLRTDLALYKPSADHGSIIRRGNIRSLLHLLHVGPDNYHNLIKQNHNSNVYLDFQLGSGFQRSIGRIKQSSSLVEIVVDHRAGIVKVYNASAMLEAAAAVTPCRSVGSGICGLDGTESSLSYMTMIFTVAEEESDLGLRGLAHLSLCVEEAVGHVEKGGAVSRKVVAIASDNEAAVDSGASDSIAAKPSLATGQRTPTNSVKTPPRSTRQDCVTSRSTITVVGQATKSRKGTSTNSRHFDPVFTFPLMAKTKEADVERLRKALHTGDSRRGVKQTNGVLLRSLVLSIAMPDVRYAWSTPTEELLHPFDHSGFDHSVTPPPLVPITTEALTRRASVDTLLFNNDTPSVGSSVAVSTSPIRVESSEAVPASVTILEAFGTVSSLHELRSSHEVRTMAPMPIAGGRVSPTSPTSLSFDDASVGTDSNKSSVRSQASSTRSSARLHDGSPVIGPRRATLADELQGESYGGDSWDAAASVYSASPPPRSPRIEETADAEPDIGTGFTSTALTGSSGSDMATSNTQETLVGIETAEKNGSDSSSDALRPTPAELLAEAMSDLWC